jgi:hypothetical protein
VHATHTVHAVPDLRIAGGRLGDGFYHAFLFATPDLRLTFFVPEASRLFEVRTDQSFIGADSYLVNPKTRVVYYA